MVIHSPGFVMSDLVLSHQLSVAVAAEVDGIEMGVLDDGRSYLTGRGLARLCGVAPSTIINQAERWLAGDRNNKLAVLLQLKGLDRPSLYEVVQRGGKKVHAYPDDICSAVLEYYAFEATPPSDVAVKAFRKLAQAGLRMFIYKAVGYEPTKHITDAWRQFHDRLEIHTVPLGYFSVFKETAEFVIAAIRGGFPANDHTIPDISIGIVWSKHWEDNNLAERFGERRRHDHNYPEYFPQAASNPQPIWIYPDSALGEFRRWLYMTYAPAKFPKYLDGKVKKGLLPPNVVQVLVVALTPPRLTG